MSTMTVPTIPESAPFSPGQRAWLNGFFAGLLGGSSSNGSSAAAAPVQEEETFPWHDAAIALDERMKLAEGRPPERVLMAAMAQLDCGSCGYLCQSYAEAIASGTDKDLTKCSPGGKETSKKLKELMTTLTISAKPATIAAPKPATNGVVGRDHPYAAPLIRSTRLNAPGSDKEVRHVEISLKGSAVKYKVGDALGVWPENCTELVEGVLERLNATGAEDVHAIDGANTSLFESLRRERVLTSPTEQLIELLITNAQSKDEAQHLQKMLTDEGGEHLQGMHVLDVLELAPSAAVKPEDFVNALGKMQPRLYSISSSPIAHADQVHLTVGAVRYKLKTGRAAKGVASTFLADRVRPGQKVRVFVHESKHFGLPADGEKPIIMVGPGTGIAPFRAFIHDRRAAGAKGRSWLFFGDQTRSNDFLYQQELESFLSEGSLSRLDVAFSRDQAHKVYVQHKMREQAAELYRWLEEGAHFYVCGDAQRMAKDVNTALLDVIRTEGNRSADDAEAYLKKLKDEGRYARDVY